MFVLEILYSDVFFVDFSFDIGMIFNTRCLSWFWFELSLIFDFVLCCIGYIRFAGCWIHPSVDGFIVHFNSERPV